VTGVTGGRALIDAGLHVWWPSVDERTRIDDEHLRQVAEAAEAVLVIENAPLPLAVLLPNGRIALANKAFADFLGYTPAELAGEDLRLIMADVSNFAKRWESVIKADGVTDDRVIRLRRRDGGAVTARAASLVVNDGDGQPRFVLARALSTRQEMAG
jgi:PAS domain S-box-containing protein